MAGLAFHWKIKLAKALAQNLLKDKATGITLMYSRCPRTLSTANNKLPGKYEDTGRLSKFSKTNLMHIQDYHFQNRMVGFRFIISFGMLTLGVWEAFFIITGKGTISFASHIQCVSSCYLILASEIQRGFLQRSRPPRSWSKRSMQRNSW